MMSAVNRWKPPQPPRRQAVVTRVFCAINVCFSDISCKSGRQQAGGIFHPQDPTEYPRHFQSLCTIGSVNQCRSQAKEFVLVYLTATFLLLD
jgi:hypothetical protein